jgi:type IV pilus assembly protein PilW
MSNSRSPRYTAGFSLIEVMIGLLIGMIAIIVMLQVFSLSETHKRTTTGGDDAQNNGALGLYAIQRDMQQSGLGVNNFQLLGCNVLLRTGVTLNAISPVTINHTSIPAAAKDAGTDTVLIVYGNPNGAGEGEKVDAQPTTTTYTVAAAAASASAPGAYAAGDQVIAEVQPRPTTCSLSIQTVSSVTSANVVVGAGVAGMSGGILYNLGRAPKVNVYAVKNGNLVMCDYMTNDCGAAGSVGNAAIWVPIGSGIASMRAEYGRDTTATPDATVDTFDQATPTTACLWSRVSAARIALVTRNSNYEKDNVTQTAPAWASTTATIDLSADTNWQHYRYKLFQTVVPLRNMAWQGAQSGC